MVDVPVFFTLRVMVQAPPVTGVVPELDPLTVFVRTGLNASDVKSSLTFRLLQSSADPLTELAGDRVSRLRSRPSSPSRYR